MTSIQPFPGLETEPLVLRKIVAANATALLEIHGAPVLMRWFGADPLQDLDAASLKSSMRLGFTEEGCLGEVAFWGKVFHHLLQFSVLRKKWKPRPPNFMRR